MKMKSIAPGLVLIVAACSQGASPPTNAGGSAGSGAGTGGGHAGSSAVAGSGSPTGGTGGGSGTGAGGTLATGGNGSPTGGTGGSTTAGFGGQLAPTGGMSSAGAGVGGSTAGMAGSGVAQGGMAMGGSAGAGGSAGVDPTGPVTVELTQTHQKIEGFGINDTYNAPVPSSIFDASKDIGLTILRVGMAPDGSFVTSGASGDITMVQGVSGSKIIGSTWTAPADCKSNKSVNDGGHLNTGDCYTSWAKAITKFATDHKLYAMSVANEP